MELCYYYFKIKIVYEKYKKISFLRNLLIEYRAKNTRFPEPTNRATGMSIIQVC